MCSFAACGPSVLMLYCAGADAYLKAPNADAGDYFGYMGGVAISKTPQNAQVWEQTLVVGAMGEGSSQTTITDSITITNGGTSTDNSAFYSGAVYVFVRTGVGKQLNAWAPEAYLKAPNADAGDVFGNAVAISGDTIVVGGSESSSQTTITNGATGYSTDNSAANAGAVYVFDRTGSTWVSHAYVKAPNAGGMFGASAAADSLGLGDTSHTIVVGAFLEASSQTPIINGATGYSTDNSAPAAGAVYVFAASQKVSTSPTSSPIASSPTSSPTSSLSSAQNVTSNKTALQERIQTAQAQAQVLENG